MTTRFGVDGCTCRPFTRTDPPRFLKIGDTVAADAITSWQKADDCPHHGEQEEPGDETPAAAWTQLEARAFNAVQPALRAVGEWLPLSARRAVANEVLAAVREHLDIGEEEAWCKVCRRVWDGPRHRCETDAEQRLAAIREALAGFNHRGVIRAGHVNLDIPAAGEVIDAIRAELDRPRKAA